MPSYARTLGIETYRFADLKALMAGVLAA